METLFYKDGSVIDKLWATLIIFSLTAYCLWLLSLRISSKEPPLIPYKIPWLGHGHLFLLNNSAYIEWVKNRLPNQPITTATIAGRHMYIIFNAKLASQVYRQSRTFAFDPFILLTCSALGSSKADMKILEIGTHDVSRNLDANAGPGVLHALHAMSVSALQGESLDRMTEVFNEHMFARIEMLFPQGRGRSYEWQEVDLVEFVKKAWTLCSVVSLFGTEILEAWPEFYVWFWDFDRVILPLFAQMPRIVAQKSYRLRDEGLRGMERWESDAVEATRRGKIRDDDSEWDPYWGLRFCRIRGQLAIDSGLGVRSRAVLQLALLWGQNANAVPVAVWYMIQNISSPNLLSKAQQEARASQTGLNNLSMPILLQQPSLRAVLLETYRWAVASPTVRVLQHDAELGGYELKAGSLVLIHARTLQMDEEIWQSNASDFSAERFLNADESSYESVRVVESAQAEKNYLHGETESGEISKTKSRDIFTSVKDKEARKRMIALRPFGGGQTLCPGRHFATNEILGGVAAMLLKLDIEVDEKALKEIGFPKVDLSKQGGLFPDRRFMVRIRRRI